MTERAPAFQFYPSDWMKDPALRMCSEGARGAWIDILCLMWQMPDRGILRVNGVIFDQKMIKKTLGIRSKFVQELIDNGVMSCAKRSKVFFSKRMVRDELKRARLARNGKKGGQRSKQIPSKSAANIEANPQANEKQKGGSSSSSSSSTSVLTEISIPTGYSAPSALPPDGGPPGEEGKPTSDLGTEKTNGQAAPRPTKTVGATKPQRAKNYYVFDDAAILGIPPKLAALPNFVEAWGRWVQARREDGHPMTRMAAEGQLVFLTQQDDPIEVVARSIRNQWQGLFPLDSKSAPPPLPQHRELPDMSGKTMGER